MWRRLSAVLALFLLSPLIAEYLLGSLPMSLIGILPLMAALYGCGAILIRDWSRRTGRGWPTMVLLATAYGLFEEGFVTQSLFNPNYLHLRLLDFGFIPALGIGLPWLIFVVTIHIVWSLSVPIGLTEGLFKSQRTLPWLGPIGLGVVSLIFLAGAALIASFTYKQLPFMATPEQFGLTGALILALIATAFLWPKRSAPLKGQVPHPLILFSVSFAAGSSLMLIQHMAQDKWHWDWRICVFAVLSLELLFVAFMILFTRGKVWSDMQRFSLMAGGLMVYVWVGFGTDQSLHGASDFTAHAAIAALFVALGVFAGWVAQRRNSKEGLTSD